MNEMLVRLRKIFNDSKESQTSIAQKLGVTPAYIWKILNKDNVSPRKLFIDSVCKQFNINEDWLRTGEGDMHDAPLDDTAMAASNILENEDVPFYDSIKRIIQIYEKLDDNAQNIINDEIEHFLENAKKKS